MIHLAKGILSLAITNPPFILALLEISHFLKDLTFEETIVERCERDEKTPHQVVEKTVVGHVCSFYGMAKFWL